MKEGDVKMFDFCEFELKVLLGKTNYYGEMSATFLFHSREVRLSFDPVTPDVDH